MFFSAYLGPEQQMGPWRTAVEQHAKWLGMRFTSSVWSQPEGGIFACAWLMPSAQKSAQPHIRATDDNIDIGMHYDIADGPQWRASSNPADESEPRLRMHQVDGKLAVTVQLLTPEHVFYTMTTTGIVVSNDLRLLIRMTGLDLDERAVYSLMQYCTVLPPFSISRQIQRLPNGHLLEVQRQRDKLAADVRLAVSPQGSPLPNDVSPAHAVRQTLDGVLQRAPLNSALFFSGGIDSGLLAARLSALGRQDVTLINSSFGSHDEESALAQRMAAHLRMRCESISYDSGRFMDVLWRVAEDYTFPFSDLSVVPMNMMIHTALPSGTQVPCVLEGNGADGFFGVGLEYPEWRRVYRIPHAVRATIAAWYKSSGSWNKRDSRTARIGRVMRRSVQNPLVLAAYSQNSLDGIAYQIPQSMHDQLTDAFIEFRLGAVPDVPPVDQFTLTLLMQQSCGYVTPKSYDALRKRGILPNNPYLDPAMMRLALSLAWEQKSAKGVSKSLLKGMLAEQVPREMVYRRKSGFVPPYETMFASQSMQSYLREIVLSPSSPLAPYFDRAVVERMVDHAQEWRRLNLEVYYFFIWTLIFLTAWLYPLHHRA